MTDKIGYGEVPLKVTYLVNKLRKELARSGYGLGAVYVGGTKGPNMLIMAETMPNSNRVEMLTDLINDATEVREHYRRVA
jgi:hypothetical protein